MSITKNHNLIEIAKQRCRELRKSQTRAETIFWQGVRNRQFKGLKFYRQYPIFIDFNGRQTFFIADFFCFEKKLVVEIDGKVHDYQKENDALRSEIINLKGIDVIRFKNDEIEKDIKLVLSRLAEKLDCG
ncbi:DUF559 domain-containing protein [candidate division KSB1 bacterium]|nr:DUF559 domain-containing protein [candidate division KSB1 bacterium]